MAALPEDSILTGWLKAVCNSSSRGSVPSFGLHEHQKYTWCTYIHTDKTAVYAEYLLISLMKSQTGSTQVF